MEDTGALPQPGSSLGTGLNHCTQSLGEYGYPKKCYLLISSKAQPNKGKQRVQSHRSLSILLPPSSPSTRPHLRPTEQMVQGTLPFSPTPLSAPSCGCPPQSFPHWWLTSLGLAGPACWPILSRPWELSRCWGRFLCFQTSGLAGLQAVAYAGLWQLSRDSVSHV